MTASKYALAPLASWMDDDARVQAELKVDDYHSTGRAMLVEAPEPGPLKLNPQAWLPRAEVRYVVPGCLLWLPSAVDAGTGLSQASGGP